MTKVFFSLILIFILASNIMAQFNYDSYRYCDLDSLIRHAPKAAVYPDSTNKNYSSRYAYDVITPAKYRFEALLSAYPKILDPPPGMKSNIYEKFLSDLGFDHVPSVNHYIKVRTKKGKTWYVLIQDALVEDLLKEIKIGDKLELYCLHFYNDIKGPGFLINDFQSAE